ncbi:MAG: TAT-variant-translocated molybdopterin oxidoreductase [Bacteroidia bacterium]|nr:TAT-variant-translocated molybdopterin oxidoreductase [Bacteroidia bacterium]
MNNNTPKKYWRGLPELHQSEEFLQQHQNEFAEEIPLDNSKDEGLKTNRRDFLKLMGFSTAAVALASCETPVNRVVPYVVKPEEIIPGVPNYYASTFYDGHDFASILVKAREGRPIKIDGNELSSINKGKTTARTQASILGLYDGARLNAPILNGKSVSWKEIDAAVKKALSEGSVRLLTSTVISPSLKALIQELSTTINDFKHIQWDEVSYSAIRSAHQKLIGKNIIPEYHFDKAKLIVGIACDFLGNWLNPVEFSREYALNRKVSKEAAEMSRHYHFESNMSLTGANADYRYMVKPSEFGKILVALYNAIAEKTGTNKLADANIQNKTIASAINKISEELIAHKGQSLVVCGVNDENLQAIVIGINQLLENYSKTIDTTITYHLKSGSDSDFLSLVEEMNAGKVKTLITYQVNPLYSAPAFTKFEDAYTKVTNKIHATNYLDETAQKANIVLANHHYLESWGDANPKTGIYTLQQPLIRPVFAAPKYEGTRQFEENLLAWTNKSEDYYTYIRNYWKANIFNLQNKDADFETFWVNALHDGIFESNPTILSEVVSSKENKKEDKKKGNKTNEESPKEKIELSTFASNAVSAKSADFELMVYEKVGMGNGNQSNNPWLMELPDPISKVVWDNYITVSLEDMDKLGFEKMLRQDKDGSIATLELNGIKIEVPVLPQPGQAPGTIGLALGYGRNAQTLKVAHQIGVNAYPFIQNSNGHFVTVSTGVKLSNTGKKHEFAQNQLQHTVMGREEWILREVSLPEFKAKDKEAFNPAAVILTAEGKKPVEEVDLWDQHPRPNHKWGLTIDMNACIGCSACVVSCSIENNVHVVGKEEVRKTRDMFWLRIDRYYSSDMTRKKAKEEGIGYKEMNLEMENPSANPKVTFQPIMCQHCNHAPCETVCPVLATAHSTEGLNQMVYNRCIGTRYCANNCPFKVRRFNWFNYTENWRFKDVNPAAQELTRMVLNPDVTVRSRGVIEKCSMCQQRIQAGKLQAKKEGRKLQDKDIQTACQQACPTNAIIFGDLNDENSEVVAWRKNERNYVLLEELGIRPTVSYLLKVRNVDEPLLDWNEELWYEKDKSEKSSNKEEAHA